MHERLKQAHAPRMTMLKLTHPGSIRTVFGLSHDHGKIGLMLRLPDNACKSNTLVLSVLMTLGLQGMAHAEVPSRLRAGAEPAVVAHAEETEIIISNIETPAEVLPPESSPPVHSALRWQSGSMPYQSEVLAAAQATALEPALIHAVIATESAYNPKAVSAKGAYGLMQMMPATAKTLTTLPIRQWSASQQILWGAHYLKHMLDMFEGNVTLALAAYNAGPQAVKNHQQTIPPFAETRHYVPKVLGYYQAFKTHPSTLSVSD